MDLGGHVDNRQLESLRAPRSSEGPGPHSEVGKYHCSNSKGRKETTGGGGSKGGGDAT